MIDILNQIPAAWWLMIHAALLVPVTQWLNNYFEITGKFLNIPTKQIASAVYSVVIGLIGHFIGLGALANVSPLIAALLSLPAGLVGNGLYTAFVKNNLKK